MKIRAGNNFFFKANEMCTVVLFFFKYVLAVPVESELELGVCMMSRIMHLYEAKEPEVILCLPVFSHLHHCEYKYWSYASDIAILQNLSKMAENVKNQIEKSKVKTR